MRAKLGAIGVLTRLRLWRTARMLRLVFDIMRCRCELSRRKRVCDESRDKISLARLSEVELPASKSARSDALKAWIRALG